MNIVLDTNILLVSIPSKSFYRPIFDSFLNQDFNLCVTTDILLEYEEIIKIHMGEEVSDNLLQIIENAENVIWATRYFKWELIKADKDDNKFVDCAIASNAKFIVSNDKHFDVLRDIKFPKVDIIKANDFKQIIISNKSKAKD